MARTADRLSLGNVGISIQDRITPTPGSLVCSSDSAATLIGRYFDSIQIIPANRQRELKRKALNSPRPVQMH